MTDTAYTRRLADIAIKQYDKYHLIREQQQPLASQIEAYWTGIAPFENVGIPWSAVFVSWCVKQSGATATEFKFAAAHSVFVHQAIQNADQDIGVFRGRDPSVYAPKLGDILQNRRSSDLYDFAYARKHRNYVSHSAIVIEVGVDQKGQYLRTVGGNESDSVGLKEVRLKPNGCVRNDGGIFISVIETLK